MNLTLVPPATAVDRTPPGQAQRTLSRTAGMAGLVLLLLIWIATGLFLQYERREAIDSRSRENMNLARALEETSVRVLATVDQATRRVSQAVLAGDEPLRQLGQFAKETGLTPGILVQLSLVGPDGRFMGSNLDPDGSRTGHVDLSEREHIRVHLAPGLVDSAAQGLFAQGLFIGKPVLGKVSGRWTIQLSRRIDGPDGRALGVVVASVDPSYFESVYRSVNLGGAGVVTLLGEDLTVRARVVDGQSVGMGQRISTRGPLAQSVVPESGSYIAPSGVDGVDRLFAFQRVSGFPLFVLVGSATSVALADWVVMRNVLMALVALLSVAVAVGLRVFTQGLRRLEASNRELAESEARAQSANQAKSEFLAAISHELRTPLTSIRGFAELMELRLPEPRFREQAGLIRKSAEHLNALLNEILDLARVEAGAMPLRSAPVDLTALIRGVTELFAVTANEKGLALNVRLADGLPATLDCDELRLKQILNNLMSNALKFTVAGSVSVEVETVPGVDQIRVHVADTGPGIAPELHELIFERFRQADARVSHQHGGTGLGLALARALAELMGGTLTLASAPGEGARFTLTLPMQPPALG
ncbi:ATP-binding protein [Sphaerotilus mobilis]|uniref:Virulence sensor protein BvgS n=1 Tax=Sphaerotilus mobilis TaxID=47994 RepID=A0A4Q7LFS8_9BURK|nr:ATP-binding protein [Sphaerotilus mobilis]RZS52178.1 signal transduction histidine kinase [Sphaerotilus mobilis]